MLAAFLLGLALVAFGVGGGIAREDLESGLFWRGGWAFALAEAAVGVACLAASVALWWAA